MKIRGILPHLKALKRSYKYTKNPKNLDSIKYVYIILVAKIKKKILGDFPSVKREVSKLCQKKAGKPKDLYEKLSKKQSKLMDAYLRSWSLW